MLDNKNLQNKLNVLDSKKQPKVTVGKSVPSKRLGNNGSMHIGLMADGVKLFVKYNGEWHQTSLDRLSKINQKNKGLTNKFINTLLLRFFDADTSHYAGLKAHSTTTTSQDYVLPAAPPASDKVLQSDSSGNLTWESLPVPDSIADDNMLGNISGSTGVATALTASQVRTLINVENGATADQTQGDINGLAITTTGALNSGSMTSGFGNIDTGSSTIDTTGAVSTGALTCTTIDTGQGANEVYDMDQNVKTDSSVGFAAITSGAVIWQSFPFYVPSASNGTFYFLDVDDTANSYRRWDTTDASPTAFDYRGVSGHFVVPEDCTLVAMHGVISNGSSTNNPTVHVYHGTVTEAASNTTLASAGNVVVTIGTARVPYKFSKEDFDTDLSAGNIVIPMISHADASGTRTLQGSLTLKFITR